MSVDLLQSVLFALKGMLEMKTSNHVSDGPVTMSSFFYGADCWLDKRLDKTEKLLNDLSAEIDKSVKLVQQIFPDDK
jgi:hypothetical protein